MSLFPVDEAIAPLREALREGGQAVLVAPPGAGKTTRVPPALLGEPWCKGRIIMLEPRRIAARAAARFMAGQLGEEPGGTIGYRVRLDSRIGPGTRIEVVTEGVFTRMIGDDPELSGISAVLFDEFHERSLEADLALALTLDVRDALRPDLRLVAMSATLDGAAVADLLGGAPVIESAGRIWPVTLRYDERPPDMPVEEAVARAVRGALEAGPGSVLAFMPGQREIDRCARLLEGRLPAGVTLHTLSGVLDGAAQDAAIRPAPAGQRKVVLATSIAETSLTIEGVATVVDSGLRRVPRFDPGAGLTSLQTVRASRAAIAQRAGRAGRTGPGLAIRLWRQAQEAALPAEEVPEIMAADLSGLALELAAWGVGEPGALRFPTPPPAPAFAEARRLLHELGALDAAGTLTAQGKAMRRLALPPRLAGMVLGAATHGQAEDAAMLAVLLTEHGLGGRAVELAERMARAGEDRSARAGAARRLAAGLAREAKRSAVAEGGRRLSVGALLSLAFPDRIAARRAPLGDGRVAFSLAGGRGASLDAADALAREALIAVAELQGTAASARILSAAALDEDELTALHGRRIVSRREVVFDEDGGRVRARLVRRLGHLVLADAPQPLQPGDGAAGLLLAQIAQRGLAIVPLADDSHALLARLAFLHAHRPQAWPPVDEQALGAGLEDWLAPFAGEAESLRALGGRPFADALLYRAKLAGRSRAELERLAPSRLVTPAGAAHTIRYDDARALVSARVQEFYGLTRHPCVLDGDVPLVLELLSPAQRPIQTTTDLPGFWSGSWSEVRGQMRGRYPKHDWPADPAAASPVLRPRRH